MLGDRSAIGREEQLHDYTLHKDAIQVATPVKEQACILFLTYLVLMHATKINKIILSLFWLWSSCIFIHICMRMPVLFMYHISIIIYFISFWNTLMMKKKPWSNEVSENTGT